MAERKAFLLRLDPAVLLSLQRWADDDLRSLNGHIEFLLRRALAEAGRSPRPATPEPGDSPPPQKPPPPQEKKPPRK